MAMCLMISMKERLILLQLTNTICFPKIMIPLKNAECLLGRTEFYGEGGNYQKILYQGGQRAQANGMVEQNSNNLIIDPFWPYWT